MSSLLAGGLLLFSCSGTNENTVSASDSTSAAPLKVNYVCPMHSEVVSEYPDTCSKCGMDLEKVN